MVLGLVYGLGVGLGVGLLSGLFFGFSGKQLAERSTLSPNEGIHRSLKLGLVSGLVSGLVVGLGVGLSFGGLFGLGAAVQHYTLRFWLWRTHLFPQQAVPFLEDATARMLLQHVGGGYSFTHRLLMDYFADLNAEMLRESAAVQTNSVLEVEETEGEII